MTKKDYVLIAEVVATFHRRYPYWNALVRELFDDLADALKDDNERFDKARFMEACRFPE